MMETWRGALVGAARMSALRTATEFAITVGGEAANGGRLVYDSGVPVLVGRLA